MMLRPNCNSAKAVEVAGAHSRKFAGTRFLHLSIAMTFSSVFMTISMVGLNRLWIPDEFSIGRNISTAAQILANSAAFLCCIPPVCLVREI
jgi:hypothetical protein